MLYSNHSLLVFSSLSYSCYKSFVSYFKKLKEIRLQSKILDNLFGHTFLYFYFYIKNIHDPPTGKKKLYSILLHHPLPCTIHSY